MGWDGFDLPKAERAKMEEAPSSPTTLVVSSPRRTLSLLRERRSSASSSCSDVAFSLHHDKQGRASGDRSPAAFAGEHGPKPSEVYGFVGSITTVIATGHDLISFFPGWLYKLYRPFLLLMRGGLVGIISNPNY
jgi:hypothetical protein